MTAPAHNRRSRTYPTIVEAEAFQEGMEEVNDSAISDIEVVGDKASGYWVVWFDQDSD